MAEAHSRLRGTRKRTHPTKCPCCISDSEPENEDNVCSTINNEESSEDKPRSKKRRREPKETGNKKEDVKNGEKSKTNNKTRSRSSSPSIEKHKKTLKKGSKKKGATGKNDKRGVNNSEKQDGKADNAKQSSNKAKKKLKTSKEKANVQENLPKPEEEFESDDEVALSNLKTMAKRKITSKNLIEGKGITNLDKEEEISNVRKTKRKASKSKKARLQDPQSIDSSFRDKVINISGTSSNGSNLKNKDGKLKNKKLGNKKGKLTNMKSLASSISHINLTTETLNQDKGVTDQIKSKDAKPKPANVDIKVKVFDHLFKTLKGCLNDRKLPIKDAANILMSISTEDLRLVIRSGRRETSSARNNISEDTAQETEEKEARNMGDQVSCTSKNMGPAKDQRPMCSDSEETISQAAEALVSFRSKSPKEKLEEVVSRQGQGSSLANTTDVQNSQEMAQILAQQTSAVFSPSQAVQAWMQFQTTNRLSAPALPSSMGDLLSHVRPQQLFPGQGLLAGNPFINMNQSATGVSAGNQNPLLASQGNLPNFSQLTTNLRQPLGTSTASMMNPLLSQSVVTSAMQPPQLLFTSQPSLQPKPQAVNTMSSSQLQVLAGMKTVTPSRDAAVMQGKPQQAILPQQPLKAMEEVIGNVGSNVQSLVWGSPLVFLGSPQTLGGVPRNIMAAQGSPAVTPAVNPQEHSGYHPVPLKPKKDIVSIAARVNQGTASSVMSVGGRPILPRMQPRTILPDVSVTSSGVLNPLAGSIQSNIFPTTTKGGPMFTSRSHGTTAVTSASVSIKASKTPTLSSTLTKHPSVVMTTGDKGTEKTQKSVTNMGVSARQAVKKLVHERTKSLELQRQGIAPANSQSPGKLEPVLPSSTLKTPERNPTKLTPRGSESSTSKSSEFNLEQAATALLSIGAQDGEGGVQDTPSVEEVSLEEPEENVVFTSKGMFRVGDVDVDPDYNTIGIEGYTCGKCGKIFTSLNYLARHIKRVCPDMSCRKWRCSLCDKAFRHPFGLQQHIYTHTGERPHKCPVCPKAFYSSNDLRRHSRIHSGERPYHCKHCNKTFATTISLKTHTYIHTGEKPHKCPQCPKTFATSSKLGRHIVTHSEQRPFTCDLCPKSFNRSGDLRRHCMTVHDGKEKTFDCEECSMTFTRSADLRRHSSSVHSPYGKTLSCGECLASFSTPLCLKMHTDTYHRGPNEQAQTPPTPYKCKACGKTYDSAVQLEKHEQAHEPASTAGYNSTQFQAIAPRPNEQQSVE